MTECIIFDCDGTLVDSEYLCNRALEIKLKDYSIDCSVDELVEKFRGVNLATILKSIEADHKIKFDQDFIPQYRQIVKALFEKDLLPCDGVKEMLSQIQLPICVASNAPMEKIIHALRLTELLDFFDGNIFSAYNVGAWKPDPEIFLFAARSMECNPQDCLIVEDSPTGIKAAKRAGIYSVLYDPNNLANNHEADIKIQHMSQLKKLISQRSTSN